MRRLSVNEFSTSRWSFFQDVVKYASLGFESIGLWRHKFNGVSSAEVADFLHEMRMTASSINWVGGFTGSDAFTRNDDAIKDAIEAIELAGAVGCQCVVLHSGSRNSHTRNHSMRLLTDAIDELIPVAEDRDVRLALEPMLPESHSDWTLFQELTGAIDLVTRYEPSQLGLVLDLFHVGLNKKIFARLDKLAPWLSLIQIADCRIESGVRMPTLLGHGDVPIEEWLFAIEDTGYRGPLEVELHGIASPGDEPVDYPELLESSRDYIVSKMARPHRSEAKRRSSRSSSS